MSDVVYVGDRFLPAPDAAVSVFDHGLLYGDGVFEGIRAYNGRVFKLERHIERLFQSAQAIRLAIPLTRDATIELVVEACRQNAIENGYIRLLVTRGAGDLGIDPRSCPRATIVVIVRSSVAIYRRSPSGGATLVTSSLRRPAPDALCASIKSLNYLNNVLARMEANEYGADEALMLDANGHVAEATVDNLFIVTDRGLATPPTVATLKGITRETILELAATLGIPAGERAITLFDVWTAREALLCGTAAEIVPVASVDGRTIGAGAPGPVTTRIMEAYRRLVESTGTPIRAPMLEPTA